LIDDILPILAQNPQGVIVEDGDQSILGVATAHEFVSALIAGQNPAP